MQGFCSLAIYQVKVLSYTIITKWSIRLLTSKDMKAKGDRRVHTYTYPVFAQRQKV